MNSNFICSNLAIAKVRPLLRRLVAVVSVLAVGSIVLVGPAEADLPVPGGPLSGVCAGKGMSHLVKRYRPAVWFGGSVPLRCGRWNGTRGWGYRKLVGKGRWNPWYDGMIGATLALPTSVVLQGTATIFTSKWFTQCSPVYRFVVIVEARLTSQGVTSGVINAYKQVKEL